MFDCILTLIFISSGIALVVIEIIFVPGTTFVGVFGCLIGGYGVYYSYELYGSTAGHYVLASSVIVGFVAIFYSFKSEVWQKFALNSAIDSKVNENLTVGLQIGEEGMTISSLKPIGKAMFEGKEYEVKSLGLFVEEGNRIKILKIERNKIYVKLID